MTSTIACTIAAATPESSAATCPTVTIAPGCCRPRSATTTAPVNNEINSEIAAQPSANRWAGLSGMENAKICGSTVPAIATIPATAATGPPDHAASDRPTICSRTTPGVGRTRRRSPRRQLRRVLIPFVRRQNRLLRVDPLAQELRHFRQNRLRRRQRLHPQLRPLEHQVSIKQQPLE